MIQPLDVSPKQKTQWKKLTEKGGTFLAIFVFNLAILLLLGGRVIYQFVVENQIEPMQAVTVKPTPPPVKPPSQSGGKGANSDLDPDTVVQPPPMVAPSLITTTMPTINTTFKVAVPSDLTTLTVPNMTTDSPRGRNITQTNESQGTLDLGNSLFGVANSNGTPMFTGTLYDFKKTADGQPTGFEPKTYHAALKDFVAHNWSDEILAKYYKFSKPLYTPQIFIPDINAALGPQQFGAEKEVLPRMWIAYYKVTVLPTEDGQYQFYGTCDDIILVRIRGKTVLDGSLSGVAPKGANAGDFKFDLVGGTQHMWGSLKQGIPFGASAGVPLDIDVIIGEEPGGWFNAFLLLGKVGTTYDKGPNGMPAIPVFQVCPAKVPDTGLRLMAGPPVVWPAQQPDAPSQ